MNVREADVKAIVLTLLDELYMGPGGQVLPETLNQEWPKIGLRDSDLGRALEGLVGEAALALEKADEDKSYYVLTESGHKRMVDLNSPLTFGLASYQRLRRHAENRVRLRQQSQAQVVEERRKTATSH